MLQRRALPWHTASCKGRGACIQMSAYKNMCKCELCTCTPSRHGVCCGTLAEDQFHYSVCVCTGNRGSSVLLAASIVPVSKIGSKNQLALINLGFLFSLQISKHIFDSVVSLCQISFYCTYHRNINLFLETCSYSIQIACHQMCAQTVVSTTRVNFIEFCCSSQVNQ